MRDADRMHRSFASLRMTEAIYSQAMTKSKGPCSTT